MKKINHKEILDFLKEEKILYTIIEDENDNGELEITGIELVTVEEIIDTLKELRKSSQDLVRQLKEKIESKDSGVFFKELPSILLRDQTINFTKDCYFLDCNNMIITNCTISNKREELKKPMITIINSK